MLTLVILLLLSIIWWKWHTRRYPGEPPTYPGALPFIGHSHLFFGDSLNFWNMVKKINYKCMDLGHAISIYFGPLKVYVVTDPDDVYKIANTCLNKDQFTAGFTDNLLNNGLLFSDESTWRRHRKLITPAFNQQIIEGFLNIFNNQGKKLVETLQVEVNKGSFDHSVHIKKNFMEIICSTALNETVDEDQVLTYLKAFDTYLNTMICRLINFWLIPDTIFKYSRLKKKRNKCIKLLHELSDSMLRKKRALRTLDTMKSGEETTKPKVRVFMDLLMDLDNGVFSDREIREEINSIIIAGHETTSSASIFALVLIGSYPEVQEKIYKELQEVIQDRDVEKEDLSRLVYLEAVIKETLRYYATVPLSGRFINREIHLKNYTLKPGYSCAILFYGIHRNPQWGPDVEKFNPDRWLHEDSMPTSPNFSTMFGIGRRSCIGKNFAMVSMKTVLSHVLRRYKIHADHTQMVLKLDAVLKPYSGCKISIEDRLKV